MLGVVGSNLTIFKLKDARTPNMSQHMISKHGGQTHTMLQDVALACCDRFPGLNTSDGMLTDFQTTQRGLKIEHSAGYF